MKSDGLTRRGFALGLSALPLLPRGGWAQGALPKVVVSKDPSCGCCGGWIYHMRKAGYAVEMIDTRDMASVKKRLGVPDDLASCHTAEIGGYVVEGHVPEPAIRRLLAEAPAAIGIAVPGMPAGSPGMEAPGVRLLYDVILFGPSGRRRYARFQGLREVME